MTDKMRIPRRRREQLRGHRSATLANPDRASSLWHVATETSSQTAARQAWLYRAARTSPSPGQSVVISRGGDGLRLLGKCRYESSTPSRANGNAHEGRARDVVRPDRAQPLTVFTDAVWEDHEFYAAAQMPRHICHVLHVHAGEAGMPMTFPPAQTACGRDRRLQSLVGQRQVGGTATDLEQLRHRKPSSRSGNDDDDGGEWDESKFRGAHDSVCSCRAPDPVAPGLFQASPPATSTIQSSLHSANIAILVRTKQPPRH
nr:hypothetical protein CFP56_03132 [Quercus suber]